MIDTALHISQYPCDYIMASQSWVLRLSVLLIVGEHVSNIYVFVFRSIDVVFFRLWFSWCFLEKELLVVMRVGHGRPASGQNLA